MTRRYEFRSATSEKFWEIDVKSSAIVVSFGRVGARAQSSRTELGSPAEARAAAKKRIAAKLRNGYEPVAARPKPRTSSTRKAASRPSKQSVDPGEIEALLSAIQERVDTSPAPHTPPASSKAIAALEHACGASLPDTLLALWRERDGSAGCRVIFDMRLCSVDDARAQFESLEELLGGRIPVLSNDAGDFVLVDLSTGEAWEMRARGGTKKLARSILHYLARCGGPRPRPHVWR